LQQKEVEKLKKLLDFQKLDEKTRQAT